MAISQTAAVTRSSRNQGLDYESLVRMRAGALPSIYAQNDAEAQRKAELAQRKKQFEDQMSFQMGAEEARSGEAQDLLSFEKDKAVKEQDLSKKKLEQEAAATEQAANIAGETRKLNREQNTYSNILGVANLGIAGYAAYKKANPNINVGGTPGAGGSPGAPGPEVMGYDLPPDLSPDITPTIVNAPESIETFGAPGLGGLDASNMEGFSPETYNFDFTSGLDTSVESFDFGSMFGSGGDFGGTDDLSWLNQLW